MISFGSYVLYLLFFTSLQAPEGEHEKIHEKHKKNLDEGRGVLTTLHINFDCCFESDIVCVTLR